jgi:hypothetical protein
LPSSQSFKTRVRRLTQSPDLVFDSPTLDAALADLPLKPAVRVLLGGLASPREDERWRAVALLGRAVALLVAESGVEAGREVIRRLLWSLNEESGAMGWGAAEACAEIMAQEPRLADEYLEIFLSHLRPGPKFLDHPALQAGALWGLGRLWAKRPRLLAGGDIRNLLGPFMQAGDAQVRALALNLAAGVAAGGGDGFG